MKWYDIEVDGRHTVKFADLPYVPLTSHHQSPGSEDILGQKLGGIIRQGEWAWLARNSMLQIVNLRNGQTISTFEFCDSRGFECCYIKCVEEIFPNNPETMLLAVILESFRGPGGGCSYVALYSVELSSVLSSIELGLHVTCARFMNASACRRTLLQNFDGCLAVGSEEGVIVLLDLNIRKILPVQSEMQDDVFVPCHIVDYKLSLTEIHRNFRQCQQDGIHFGLQMEVIESPCSIQCILPIDLILGLAIGLEDGRLALYDLAELQIFYIALPQQEVTMSALVKIDFLEPPDDPRPCLYIWTMHENGENLHAVLHSLMYEKRLIEDDNSNTYYESFHTGSLRLQLPLEATKSVALSCQAISTLSSHGEDDSNCLCAISWYSVLEEKNKVLVFDLNQWYKEEMPFALEYGKQPNYLAGYILNGECTGLHTLLNPDNIAHFNSMQRFEEHFYPNSLSFDCSLLHTNGCRRYNWEGAQNRVINLLRSSNAAIFLDPTVYFNEVIRTRLMPQLIEMNINSTFSRNAKYEILLSTALEHNCVSLLRDCAKSWIDGSFMGNFTASTGLSLSTLTDWIWKRATDIKTRCNDLCKSLFEFGGYPLDNREQKELGFITRQLKLLSDLLGEILVYAKKQIPEGVYSSLKNKHSSLCMASSYQDILLWLLNIGLLPEASPHNDKINTSNDLVPYPYKQLKDLYKKKRSYFAKINDTFISKKSGSCRLLYIDAFIDHACKGTVLHEYWLENDGDGLYPPNSIEAMLRVILVPDLDYDNKCSILLYFFLDLNMAIDEDAYKDVVGNFIKFPSVFKLSASLIKTVQAFWNLDHDHFLAAVDEFISPFNKNQNYPQWLVELLIEALLTQNSANLALRILESQPSLISPMLKLKTLLANELISEAFHYVRSKNDDKLLEIFFTCCLCNGKFGVIRDLALSEREGFVLQNILKRSKAPGAESLHFVYLLQKSKYIEAVSYMDELSSKSKGMRSSSLQQSSHLDTPNLVLSAFNTTMTPVTQGLTDVYFRIKNKIKKKEVHNKSPVPLSCQLIKQNANSLLGGIYHSSALSAHFATYYWGEWEEQKQNEAKHLLNSNNAPFLRRPQMETNYIDYLAKNNLSYPQVYRVTEKRTLPETEFLLDQVDELERQKVEQQQNPKKKRRLIGQEIVDDLSHFMQTNKNCNNLNAAEFKFAPENPPLDKNKSQDPNKASIELLTRPLTAKSTRHSQETAAELPEIQSILKSHTPESGYKQRDVANEEEKNLRFRLPSSDLKNSQKQVFNIQSGNVDEEEMNISAEVEDMPCSSMSFIATTKITRAVSEESNKSSVTFSIHSEDNFYTPLSSQNNSKLDCSSLSKNSFLNGPQARKPLSRLSAERSEKSVTPEPGTKSNITEASKEASNLGYVTAMETLRRSSTSPRKPLETLEKSALPEQCVSIESSNKAYFTAFETLTTPLTSSYLNTKKEVTQTSSGFGSISSQGTFASSKINEFLPKVSSSKVGTTPVKTVVEIKPPSPAKLSECSTVLGSLTTFECTNSGSNSVFAMPKSLSSQDEPTEKQKRQMLETTLSMSTIDFSMLDSTSLPQTKSSLMVTAKDTAFIFETTKSELKLEKEQEINEQMVKADEKMERIEEELAETEKENRTIFKEDPNDDIVVLSSSSSSYSSEDENEYENKYSGNEEEEEIEDEMEVEEDDYGNEVEYDEDENEEDNDENFDEENSEIEESNYIHKVDNEEKQSINEFDNESYTENEEVIQLIEDYSSDLCQPTNYYEDSDSDDVNVVDIEKPLASTNAEKVKENIAFANYNVENRDEQVLSAITSALTPKNLPKENNDQDEILPEPQTTSSGIDIQINESKSTSATGESLEKNTTITATDISATGESLKKDTAVTSTDISVPETSSKIDIQIIENVSTSVTQIIQEKCNAAGKENMDISIKSCEEVENKPEIPKGSENVGNSNEHKANVHDIAEAVKDLNENSNIKMIKAQISTFKTQDNLEITEAVIDFKEDSNNDLIEIQTSITKIHDSKETVEAVEDLKEDSFSRSHIQDTPEDNKDSRENKEKIVNENQNKLENIYKEQTSKVFETTEDEPITLIMEDSIDCSDIKLQNPSETIGKKPEENEEKSTEINKEDITENKNIGEMFCSSEKSKFLEKCEELQNEDISTPVKGRTFRGSSVPPMELESNEITVSPPQRNTRGISVPPQTLAESEEFSTLTPRTRRSLRASSLQPKNKLDEDIVVESGTPRKREKLQDSENPESRSRASRGSSLSPGEVAAKISTRRRSTMLDAINEDPATLDSPSFRTRLRSRLNSVDSELDSPIVGTDQPSQPKRTRRTSISSNISELTQTPKRARRNSLSSQPETSASLTPRTLRGRSVLSVLEEKTERMPDSPTPGAGTKRFAVKRTKSTDEQTNVANEKTETDERQLSPKSDHSTTSGPSYSTTSRRLTRTQLAMMEKSAAITQSTTHGAVTISPPPNKRNTKTRSTRSSNVHQDSDDAESVSSRHSTASSAATSTRRRITLKAIKEKDEMDDDVASVASSVGSDKHQKSRRSNDKSSPNTTLTVIPEEAAVETKKRGRPTKH